MSSESQSSESKAAKSSSPLPKTSHPEAVEKLPFEPNRKKAKPTTAKTTNKAASTAAPRPSAKVTSATAPSKSSSQPTNAIPDVVSKRMVQRMAICSGVPTALGMLTFVVSYIVVSQGWYKLPNVAVLLVSLGCFGLGVLGLSYGVLSASWEETRSGSWLGWGEFRTNLGRLVNSWQEARQQKQQQKTDL